jgi:hypothetical protein
LNVNYIPLTDEDTFLIFAGEAKRNLEALDRGQQDAVIDRLSTVVGSAAPPSAYVYERIGNLDIVTVGDQGRLYTRIVEDVPRGNARYHLVYLFFIDATHDYPRTALATYTEAAAAKATKATSLDTVASVDAYLDRMNALDSEDLSGLST